MQDTTQLSWSSQNVCEWDTIAAVVNLEYTMKQSIIHSVVSDSLQPHGLYPTRLLCPWDSPGKNTGVDFHALLQGIFLTQGWNLCLCNVGDLGSIPGLRRSPGEGKGYPLQQSGPENSMNCIVRGVTKSWTGLSDFDFDFLHIYMAAMSIICTNQPNQI